MKATAKTSPVNIEERKTQDIRPGDVVKVHQKIQEKGKTRIQIFEGMVLARKHGTDAGATFTVRRVANGYGVEKIYPLYSPLIEKIEVVRRAEVRKAKLYYVRTKAQKELSKRMRSEMMRADAPEAAPAELVVAESN
ncbi:MAG: 50S ribosomal protein L19 [Patescibacteria group bacterium]